MTLRYEKQPTRRPLSILATRMFAFLGRYPRLAVSLAIVLTASVLRLGGAPLTGSDPYGTAVVAQSLLHDHELTLSGINAQFFRETDGKLRYQAVEMKGRVEYYFPIGTVILALPLVALGDAFGSNPLRHERNVQRHMIFLTLLITIAILYRWCRRFFDRSSSLTLAMLGFLGTVAAPTVTSAYWSTDPEIVFSSIAYLILTREYFSFRVSASLGLVLFMGFLCRPTFAAVIVCVLPALTIQAPRACAVTSVTALLLLIGFVLFSENHYGTYLPPYYLASRLSNYPTPDAMRGLLISPSRGLLIFSPIVLLPLIFIYRIPFSKRKEINIALFSAIVLLFIGNALFVHWSGGFSYGPRLLATASFLAVMLSISIVAELTSRQRLAGIVIGITLLGIGATINLPGIYVENTYHWNESPNVDDHPQAIFDWRHPQFLTWTYADLAAKCLDQLHLITSDKEPACPSVRHKNVGK